MVFDSIISPQTAERKPWDAFLLAFALATVSIMLSLIVFTPYGWVNLLLGVYALAFIIYILLMVEIKLDGATRLLITGTFIGVTLYMLSTVYAWIAVIDYRPFATPISLSIVFFTSLALAPLMVKLLQVEEKQDIEELGTTIWERHSDVLLTYSMLFLGAVLAFSLWFTLLPPKLISAIFYEQIAVIKAVSGMQSQGLVVGYAIASKFTMWGIIMNNIKVLLVATFLAFCIGSGAIFILTWNASVIAVAIGDMARRFLVYTADLGHFAGLAAYFYALPLSLSRLALHGVPEIVAYFIGGLAGGILSVAATAHQGRAVWVVIKDATKLLIIAILTIVAAGYIEAASMGII